MKVPTPRFVLAAFAAIFSLLLSVACGDVVPDEIVIDAFVDGPSTFHVTPEGFYWTNGTNNKPGKWHGANEATYINDAAWYPVWGRPDANGGPDKSALYPLKLYTVDLNFHLIAVTQERGLKRTEKRTPPIAKRDEAEFTVIIPDPESGPRWYRFSLRKR